MPSRWSPVPNSARNSSFSRAIPAGPGVPHGPPERFLRGCEGLPGALGEPASVPDRRVEDLVGGQDPLDQSERLRLLGIDLSPV